MQAPRRWVAAAAAITALALSGCSASEPMTIEEGVPHYRSMAKEMADALSAEFPSVKWTREAEDLLELDEDGRDCELFPASYKSEHNLLQASPGLTQVMDTVNPILEKFHFRKVEHLSDVPGGWTVIRSEDVHGAEFELATKGSSRLSLHAPLVAGDCSADLPDYGS